MSERTGVNALVSMFGELERNPKQFRGATLVSQQLPGHAPQQCQPWQQICHLLNICLGLKFVPTPVLDQKSNVWEKSGIKGIAMMQNRSGTISKSLLGCNDLQLKMWMIQALVEGEGRGEEGEKREKNSVVHCHSFEIFLSQNVSRTNAMLPIELM
jgi:hypothetical protein